VVGVIQVCDAWRSGSDREFAGIGSAKGCSGSFLKIASAKGASLPGLRRLPRWGGSPGE